jgi:hypothetical protein
MPRCGNTPGQYATLQGAAGCRRGGARRFGGAHGDTGEVVLDEQHVLDAGAVDDGE